MANNNTSNGKCINAHVWAYAGEITEGYPCECGEVLFKNNDFGQIVNDNFWELIDKKENKMKAIIQAKTMSKLKTETHLPQTIVSRSTLRKLTIKGIFNDYFTDYKDKESSVSMTVDIIKDCTCGEKRCLIHEMPSNYILSAVQDCCYKK